MSPFYGKRSAPAPYRAPDWLLGGHRKRLVLQALAKPDGQRADELAEELGIGRATVFEILRALRDLGVLVVSVNGGWRLDTNTQLGGAIATLLSALAPLEHHEVARPPRARDQAGNRRGSRPST